MSDTSRKSKRHVVSALTEALALDTSALVTANVLLQPSYANGSSWALSANDNSPLSSEPDVSRLIFAGDGKAHTSIGQIALFPIYTAAAGATVFHVWVKSGLTGVSAPKWIRIKTVNFDGSTSDVETRVDIGNRTAFIQAVSGVNTNPVTLYVAVA